MQTEYNLRSLPPPSSLTRQAYELIKEAILTWELRPGDILVERQLAKRLGISKTPVRDALLMLEQEGFVVKEPYRGTTVAPISLKDAEEIRQLRETLEGLAVRIAAPLFSPLDLEEARAHVSSAEVALEQGDVTLAAEKVEKFHQLLVQKAENKRLSHFIQQLDDHSQRLNMVLRQIPGRAQRSIEEHKRILAAIEENNPALAVQAVQEHIRSLFQEVEASLAEQVDETQSFSQQP
jgi:DNA-binding GntR family transcriptional regulator